jgi:hypothetical protein
MGGFFSNAKGQAQRGFEQKATKLTKGTFEGAEKRQKDFNHGSNGFNGWNCS